MSVYSRQHPRVAATFALTYIAAPDSVVHHGRSRDISGGGLFIETQEPIRDPTVLLAISFEIRGVAVKARGRVLAPGRDAANMVYTYRLVFTDISYEDQTFLAAYVLRSSLDAILSKACTASYQRARKPRTAPVPKPRAALKA
jgi:hypothetical protein